MQIKTDHPEGVEQIMKGFEELWPKIIFFDPEIKPWYNLLQNVYAQGMLTTFQYISDHTEEDTSVPEVTIH